MRDGRARRQAAKRWAVFAAAVSASCAGAPNRGDTGIRKFGFDLWDVHCPSGLRVVLERAPGSTMVGVTTVVGVGSSADPAGREGLAHVVEHLAFRGHAEGQPEAKLRLGAAGALSNAFTKFDETTYFELAPAASLATLLAIEGDRLSAPLAGIDDDTFKVEREVVRNELRERNETDSRGFGFKGVEAALFPPSHPYARPIIGTHDSLSAVTLADAQAFVAAHYRPSEMTMVVIGDIDLTHADDLMKRLLPPALYGDPAAAQPIAKAGSRRPPVAPPPTPPPAPAALPRLPAEVTTRELWIGWTTPGAFGSDRFVTEIWGELAGQNFWRGRFDDDDVAGVSFFTHPGALASVFGCRVRLTTGDHAEKSLREVISSLPWIGGDEIYLDQRVDHLKAWALNDLAFSAEGAATRGQERASYAHITGSLGYYGETIAAVQAITAEQARDFAARYLTAERARAVLLEPVAGNGTTLAAKGEPPIFPSRPRAPLDAPAIAQLAQVQFLRDVRRVTLPNGLPTLIIHRAGAPVVTASLGLHGGWASAGPGVGAASRHAIKLYAEDSPGDYGIEFGFRSESDLATVTAQSGAGNLPRALDMLVFAMRSYDLEWPSDKFKETVLPFMKREEAGPVVGFEKRYHEALFQSYAPAVTATGDQMAGTKRSELAAWLDRTFNPRNALLIIAGDVDPARAEEAARDSFGGWNPSGDPVAPSPPFSASARTPASVNPLEGTNRFLIVNRAGATQVVVRLGCLLPPGDARSHVVGDVAADVLEQRLREILRDELGSTYGVYVDARSYRGAGTALQMSAAIDNASFEKAWGQFKNAFETSARSAFATESDVAFARGGLASRQLLHNERSASLVNEVLEAWNQGWALESPDQYIGQLSSVAVEEVNTTLARCAAGTQVALLGDEATIRAAIERRAPPAVSGSASP